VTWCKGHPLSLSLSWSRGPVARDARHQGVIHDMSSTSRLVCRRGGGSWIIATGCQRVCSRGFVCERVC
jgi:hypothetical protein